ncbi:MAG TPA: hypothetical protein PKA58_00220 [Polyangium sp.]|nr:hypothetical protein [Polyangium sp.]
MPYIRMIGFEDAGERLRGAYEAMAKRPIPDCYRAPHGGPAGIIRAHSIDPELMGISFGASGSYWTYDALTWAERELIAASASRSNGCFY